MGLDYNWIYRNFNFFGEVSQSIDAGKAITSGAIVMLDPKLSLAVLYRDFDRDFQPISSAAIGENSANENEKGLYTGIIAKMGKNFSLTAYYDQFSFGWLRFGIDAPSKGHQYITQLNYRPSRKLEMYIRIRQRLRDKSTQVDVDDIDYLVDETQTNYRFNYSKEG